MDDNKKISYYMKNQELDLEKIISEYSSYIGTIISNMTNNTICDEDKEEICSNVFFILWKNTNTLNINNYLSSYIAGIARNLVREYFRNKPRNIDISDYENKLYSYDEINIFDDNYEKISKIESLIEKMKDIDKDIFIEFYYSSKSIKDIAMENKMSETNVKQKLYRIRKKIRKEVKHG